MTRQTQHRPQRESTERQLKHQNRELRQEAQRLRREVARLRRELEKRESLFFVDPPEAQIEVEVPPKPHCPNCGSIDLVTMSIPPNKRLTVCRGCQWRKADLIVVVD